MLKPIINAPIKFVNTLNDALAYASQSKVIYVGEDQNVPNYFIHTPALLPPVDAAYAEINGNLQAYYDIYNAYMNSDIVQDICNQILALLYNGVPVTLYMQDGNDLAIGDYIRGYFYNAFGLFDYGVVQEVDMYGNPYFPYYDTVYTNVIAYRLYTFGNGIISGQDYILYIDNFDYMDGEVFRRLKQDFNMNPNIDSFSLIEFLKDWRAKYYEFYINPTSNIPAGQQISALTVIDEEKLKEVI